MQALTLLLHATLNEWGGDQAGIDVVEEDASWWAREGLASGGSGSKIVPRATCRFGPDGCGCILHQAVPASREFPFPADCCCPCEWTAHLAQQERTHVRGGPAYDQVPRTTQTANFHKNNRFIAESTLVGSPNLQISRTRVSAWCLRTPNSPQVERRPTCS